MKCPHCNKTIEFNPLEGLKYHLRIHIQKTNHRLSQYKSDPLQEHGITETTKQLKKWQSWLDAIEDLELKIDEKL